MTDGVGSWWYHWVVCGRHQLGAEARCVWNRMAGPGGMERCQVHVHVLAPRGVSLGAEEDHLCGSLEPILDGGSNTWLAPTHGLGKKDGPWA